MDLMSSMQPINFEKEVFKTKLSKKFGTDQISLSQKLGKKFWNPSNKSPNKALATEGLHLRFGFLEVHLLFAEAHAACAALRKQLFQSDTAESVFLTV